MKAESSTEKHNYKLSYKGIKKMIKDLLIELDEVVAKIHTEVDKIINVASEEELKTEESQTIEEEVAKQEEISKDTASNTIDNEVQRALEILKQKGVI